MNSSRYAGEIENPICGIRTTASTTAGMPVSSSAYSDCPSPSPTKIMRGEIGRMKLYSMTPVRIRFSIVEAKSAETSAVQVCEIST